MTKRRVLAVLVALAMLIGGLPVSGLEANAAQKHCNNGDDCTVCTVADMINELPDADDIDVYNAAAVVEQIHAIDRIKVELTDDEYDEMIKLVDADNDGSGYGVDVPTRYLNAVMAINDLNAGGALYIQKKYSVGDRELNWNETDATIKVECIDENTKFEPLKVTLANATDSYLGAIGVYSENADGWTNQYILPAGTYKITETGYHAVTEDGDKLATTATYDVGGTETTDYAIVEVKSGEESSVAVWNSYAPTAPIAVMLTEEDENKEEVCTYLSGISFTVFDSTRNMIGSYTSSDTVVEVVGLVPEEEYTILVKDTEDYYYKGSDNTDVNGYEVNFTLDEDGKISSECFDSDKEYILLKFAKIDKFFIKLNNNIRSEYGTAAFTSILDLENSTCNGQPLSDDMKRPGMIGLAVSLIYKNAEGDELNLANGDVLVPGKYTVFGVPNGENRGSIFSFSDPVTVIIDKKQLNVSDFTVEALNKEYDGTKDASFSVKIKKEILGQTDGVEIKKILGRDQFLYDDVKAVITGEFSDANTGENKEVIYEITGLTGEDADKYTIEGGSIKGKTNAAISGTTAAPDENQPPAGGSEDSTTDPSNDEATSNDKANVDTDSATNTGDDFDLLLMMTIMLLTMAIMSIVVYAGRRRTQ